MFQKIILAIIFVVCATGFAQAQKAATPNVSKRQIHQKQRIQDGIKNGDLTKSEVVNLSKQQARIIVAKKRAKADGKVTPKERIQLSVLQQKANNNIQRKKNNHRKQQKQ